LEKILELQYKINILLEKVRKKRHSFLDVTGIFREEILTMLPETLGNAVKGRD